MSIYTFDIGILIWVMKKHYGVNLNDKVLPIRIIDAIHKDNCYYDINNNQYIMVNDKLAKQL